jgi:hypothetical protein
LARRLYDTLPATAGPAQRAHRLDNLSVRLSALGRRRDALIASTQAVEAYHRLAADSAAFEPDLARALTNLGADLADLGRLPDAVPPPPKPWTFTAGWPLPTPLCSTPTSPADCGFTRAYEPPERWTTAGVHGRAGISRPLRACWQMVTLLVGLVILVPALRCGVCPIGDGAACRSSCGPVAGS